MKKILIVILLLLTLTLSGCDLFTKNWEKLSNIEKNIACSSVENDYIDECIVWNTDKANAIIVAEFKEDLIHLINKFGEPRWWSDDLNEYLEDGVPFGSADMIIYEKDYMITTLYFEQDKYFIILDLEFDEAEVRDEQLVWNVMITYVDFENEKYIDLDYYHYDKLLIPDFKAERLDYVFDKLVSIIKLLTVEDFQDILNEIGYDDIANPIGEVL